MVAARRIDCMNMGVGYGQTNEQPNGKYF